MLGKKLRELMDFLTRLMRFVFWLLVLSWTTWLLKKAVAWALRKTMGPAQGGVASANARGAGSATRNEALAPRKLVRDPVCGVYLAEVLAIPMRDHGQLLHFCSTACRDKYVATVQRRAANG